MTYPENILRLVRQNLDLEPTDTSMDDEINNMSRNEVLNRVCEWEGLIAYGKVIHEWIKDIYSVDLDKV